MWFIGVEVEKRRVHPLLKKILDPPLNNTYIFPFLITYWAQEVLPLVGRYLSLFEK